MKISHPPIQAILFDLDDTLLDRSAGFVRYCKELYQSSPVMQQTHTEAEAVALLSAWDWTVGAMDSRQDFFGNIIRQWPGVFDSLEHALVSFGEQFPRLLALEPQTRQLLQDLRDRGVLTAIVTNGGSIFQRAKIRANRLEELVKAIVVSEEAGVAKPDKLIFEKALSLIGADPLSTIFVGDNPDADILGAKALGMRTAWMHHNRQWPYPALPPDYTLGHVSEVRSIVLS